MSNIDIIRKFYGLPRITSEDRRELLGMFHEDVHYVGVGKESARGRDAIERLFRKYEASGRGITSLKFDIKHIAENGNAVLVDMVDTFVDRREGIQRRMVRRFRDRERQDQVLAGTLRRGEVRADVCQGDSRDGVDQRIRARVVRHDVVWAYDLAPICCARQTTARKRTR